MVLRNVSLLKTPDGIVVMQPNRVHLFVDTVFVNSTVASLVSGMESLVLLTRRLQNRSGLLPAHTAWQFVPVGIASSLSRKMGEQLFSIPTGKDCPGCGNSSPKVFACSPGHRIEGWAARGRAIQGDWLVNPAIWWS